METALRRSGEGFLRKTFTDAELAYCAGRAEKLAGRWAAKEAVIKCFAGTPQTEAELLNRCTDAERIVRPHRVPMTVWDGKGPLPPPPP